MSINDPGWGDGGFDDHGGGGSGGGDGWGGAGGEPPKQRPAWLQKPAYLGGGLVVLIVVVVVLVLVVGGGGKSKNTGKTTPIPTTSSSSPSPTPTSSSPSPTPTKAVFTLAEYAAKADAICTTYKPQLMAAENESLSALVSVATDELGAIQALGSPDTGTASQEKWIQQVTVAFQALEAGNTNAYNTAIVTADTTAGSLGMKVCNYGY